MAETVKDYLFLVNLFIFLLFPEKIFVLLELKSENELKKLREKN